MKGGKANCWIQTQSDINQELLSQDTAKTIKLWTSFHFDWVICHKKIHPPPSLAWMEWNMIHIPIQRHSVITTTPSVVQVYSILIASIAFTLLHSATRNILFIFSDDLAIMLGKFIENKMILKNYVEILDSLWMLNKDMFLDENEMEKCFLCSSSSSSSSSLSWVGASLTPGNLENVIIISYVLFHHASNPKWSFIFLVFLYFPIVLLTCSKTPIAKSVVLAPELVWWEKNDDDNLMRKWIS